MTGLQRRWGTRRIDSLAIRRRARTHAALVLAFACPLLGGCGANGDDAPNRSSVLLFAAASFGSALAEVETTFEERFPDVDVEVNLGGSSSLRVQLLEGAPADVFVSADETNMADVVEAGVAIDPAVFARNRMQIAVPVGNPAGVHGLDDFADDGLLIGLCAVGVPCGDFARRVLANAEVVPSLDTNEADVRALLTKIAADELDAGIVYASDLVGSDDIEGIDIPSELNVETVAPLAVLRDAPNRDAAMALVEFMLSPDGQRILRENGFAS